VAQIILARFGTSILLLSESFFLPNLTHANYKLWAWGAKKSQDVKHIKALIPP
jgi:hypothetical protein